MNHYRALLLVACLAAPVAFAANPAAANRQAAPASYPTRAMTTQQVLTQFGAPEQKLAPTPRTAQGPLKPPIVRWVYADFTVYFAHNRVIHTVLTHPRKAPIPETR